MSKATNYAHAVRAASDAQPNAFKDPREGTVIPGPYLRLDVDSDGACRLFINGEYQLSLPAPVAVYAATWLLDVFSERSEDP